MLCHVADPYFDQIMRVGVVQRGAFVVYFSPPSCMCAGGAIIEEKFLCVKFIT